MPHPQLDYSSVDDAEAPIVRCPLRCPPCHRLCAAFPQLPPRLLGLALVALSAFCFSVMSMLIKIAARTGLGPIAIASYRGFGAFAFNAAYGECIRCSLSLSIYLAIYPSIYPSPSPA
jgi:hypothetical protein